MSPAKQKWEWNWPGRKRSRLQKAVNLYLWKCVVLPLVLLLIANIGGVYALWGKITRDIRTRVLAEATTIAKRESHQDFKKEVVRFRESIAEAITETRTRGQITEEILSSMLVDKIIPMIEQLGTLKNRGERLEADVDALEKETKEFTADARAEIQSQIKSALEEMKEPEEQLRLLSKQIDVLEEKGLTVGDVQEGIGKLESFLASIENNKGVDRLVSLEQRLRELVPLGSIIAWHRDLKGVPKILPKGWVTCDGRTISGGDLDGVNTPNLNDPSKPGFIEGHKEGGAFLRGGTASGTPQEEAFKSHHHMPATRAAFVVATENGVSAPGTAGIKSPGTQFFDLSGSTESEGGQETRPVNMSVVWIMRVK